MTPIAFLRQGPGAAELHVDDDCSGCQSLSWAAVPLQPHSRPRMGASSPLCCGSATPEWTCTADRKCCFVSRISDKEQVSFPSYGTQGQNKNRPCADRPWLKQSPRHWAHPSRVPDRQGAAIRLMAPAAQPEVGVCSSVRQKAHELAPSSSQFSWRSGSSMQSALVPSPTLVCKRFSHEPITTAPRLPTLGQNLRDLPKLSRCDPPNRHRPSHP